MITNSEFQIARDTTKMNWLTIAVIVGMHVGAIAALFMFSWRVLVATILLYWLTTGLGISMGCHRLHTHRSYRIPLGLEYFFAVCGALTSREDRSPG